MSMKQLFLRVLAVASLTAGVAFAPVAPAQAADARYVTLEPAQPSDSGDKVEVLEFFAYTCPHCFAMEPLAAKWASTLPDNVVFKRVPIAFNAGMADLQKLYYSLEALDRLDLHEKVFHALHRERQRITSFKAITDWIEQQGVDRAQFEAAFNSFGINNKVSRANELAKNYGINSTPSFAIGGRYVTSPGMTGTYESAIEEVQARLDAVLGKK
jgi:thiol:disulfide interchange protein DsbA